ncbi:hypothetical protein EK21DRAFT_113283 [Setomelanomma holmii]|uniref:Clr5 domain-containing protein n=1 Tax=Setomelanomma holmii TaxID=210430 RepID=A0A9P4LKS8_9PLEO|nr:hypothetical protein EK21DRAFT_113283 [Setomelanomma holmii]
MTSPLPSSAGLSWGHVPTNQIPTPLPELMDLSESHNFAGIYDSGYAISSHPSQTVRNPQVHNSETKPTNFLSSLGAPGQPSSSATTLSDRKRAIAQRRQTTRRPKKPDLDWNANRDTLHRLYIDEGQVLTETMEIMKSNYNFEASAKAYKEQFKLWGWQKHLPGQVAHWMVDQAANGKHTAFEYGGKIWTVEQAKSSAARTKKNMQDASKTPEGIRAVTPTMSADRDSPTNAIVSPRSMDIQPDTGPIVTKREMHPKPDILPLSFNGKSMQELATVLLSARDYVRSGDLLLAETSFMEALEGMQRISSPTCPEAAKVGYELASFYSEQGRKVEADDVLEKITANHLSSLGINHRKTKQHILHVAELLNNWNRGQDAYTFLNHAREMAQDQVVGSLSATLLTKGKTRADNLLSGATGPQFLYLISSQIALNPTSNNIDHGLDNARLHTAVEEPAVVVLLKAIEKQCAQEPANLAVQGLRARAELLKYYLKQGVTLADQEAFLTAPDVLQSYWTKHYYVPASFKSHEAVEAALELTAGVLRGKFDFLATRMFRNIEQKATTLFGSTEERTIWMFISIGILYQTYRSWDEAQPWFEQAWAAADSMWGFHDGVTRSLTNAFAKRHFSYMNDESRPFKTAYGVCGFTVRPTRLHIE